MISNWSSQGHRESRLAMARTQMLRRSDVFFFFWGGKGTAILLSFLFGFHRLKDAIVFVTLSINFILFQISCYLYLYQPLMYYKLYTFIYAYLYVLCPDPLLEYLIRPRGWCWGDGVRTAQTCVASCTEVSCCQLWCRRWVLWFLWSWRCHHVRSRMQFRFMSFKCLIF